MPELIKKANELNLINNFKNFSVKNIKHSENAPGKIVKEDLKSENNSIRNNLKVNLLDSFCLDFWNFLMITPSGDIQFCLKKFNYGFNINKDRICDVWRGKRLQKIRENFLRGKRFRECDVCCPGKIFELVNVKKEMRKKLTILKNKNIESKKFQSPQGT